MLVICVPSKASAFVRAKGRSRFYIRTPSVSVSCLIVVEAGCFQFDVELGHRSLSRSSTIFIVTPVEDGLLSSTENVITPSLDSLVFVERIGFCQFDTIHYAWCFTISLGSSCSRNSVVIGMLISSRQTCI